MVYYSMVYFRKCEKGSVLLLAMLIMFVFLTLGFAAINMTSSEIKVTTNNVKSAQAFYVAEAGIAEALSILYSNPGASGTIVDSMAIGNGLVTVTGSWSGDVITLEAVGKVGEIKRTVKQNVQVVVTGKSIFDDALTSFADSSGYLCKLLDNVEVIGDATIGTRLEIDNDVKINGILYTNQEPIKNNSSVEIELVDDLELPYFPQIPEWQKPNDLGPPCEYTNVNNVDDFKTGQKYYLAKRVNLSNCLELNDIYIECSSLNLSGKRYSGVIFVVDGPITIKTDNSSFENVTLVANSSITIEGNKTIFKNVLISTSGDFKFYENHGANFEKVQIFAHGDISCSNNINVKQGFVMSYQNIYLNNNFELEGHILAKGNLTAKNQVKIIGSIGFGGATLENKVAIIHSKNTGAQIPHTIPSGVEIIKLRWSEGQRKI